MIVRVRVCGQRDRFTIGLIEPRDVVKATAAVKRIAKLFTQSGSPFHEARAVLKEAEKFTSAKEYAEALDWAETKLSKKRPVPAAAKVVTFRELAEDWTSGRLHTRFPNHGKNKDYDLDKSRLEKLFEVDVGGRKLGDVPLPEFTVDHAEAAMRGLPTVAKRPATRRGYAQVLNHVLALAVYPCRVIAVNPLPKGFMPKIGKPPAFTFLYPAEDRALLACKDIPKARRLLWGFLAREGCRLGEALELRFRDLDLANGAVTLQRTKTGQSRTWALNAAVVVALTACREERRAALLEARPELQDAPEDLAAALAGALVFVDENGAEFIGYELAERLRDDLKDLAKVERAELYGSTEHRRQLRVHDLRGTFVTLSLANERSETWVVDRTGHT